MDITVATTPGRCSRPSSFQLSAMTASSWSPSTTWPRSSTIMTRSASPSSAMPISARISRTLCADGGEIGRAAILVDVEAVRLDADRDHIGAHFPQRAGRHLVGGAVGAIDDHAQAVEREIALRQRELGEFDVAVLHAVDALGAAEIVALGQLLAQIGIEQLLDLRFDLVAELEAVRPEQLDAVVVEGIMRGRDHHAEIGAHRARQHADRRRRDRAGQQHVHADRGEAGDQRVLDHVAGQPGVLADQHTVAVIAVLEHQPGGLADLERQFRRNDLVGPAANAVGAEITTNHELPLTPTLRSRARYGWSIGGRPTPAPRGRHSRANAVNLLQKL